MLHSLVFLSLAQLLTQFPTLLACLVLLFVLYRKRHTFTARDILAGILAAVLVFSLLSGVLYAIHAPAIAVHLLGSK